MNTEFEGLVLGVSSALLVKSVAGIWACFKIFKTVLVFLRNKLHQIYWAVHDRSTFFFVCFHNVVTTLKIQVTSSLPGKAHVHLPQTHQCACLGSAFSGIFSNVTESCNFLPELLLSWKIKRKFILKRISRL